MARVAADHSFVERVAANESVHRQVNENLQLVQSGGDEEALHTFVCECALLGCSSVLEITTAEYGAVRRHARRFFVRHGHVVPATEDVVEEHPRYQVVHKHESAGPIVDATDPRRMG